MDLREALASVSRKEGEARTRLERAGKKAEAIRYEGEESATREYRRIRDELKDTTRAYRAEWEGRLEALRKSLDSEARKESGALRRSASKRRAAAADAAYSFLVAGV